ncbi:MAG TPA: hypothetical protein VMV06_02410 [Acidimicrobiales bacterium]|nr:hypothetical protein [Acidimicrobiales bacterium]
MRGPGWPTVRARLGVVGLVLLAAPLAAAPFVAAPLILGSLRAHPGPAAPVTAGAAKATPTSSTNSSQGMYAYYYLWWDTQHWQTTLGAHYPFGQSPLPLPATLDSSGCNPSSLYSGNIETDAPASLFTEDDPLQVTYDVQSALAAGLSGFAVDWYGTGSAAQTPASNAENARLDSLVRAVDQAQAEGHNFHLWLSYEASSTSLTQTAITGDLSYLSSRYGNDPAFDRSNDGRPTFIWVGSYKYPTSVVAAISGQFRSAWYFVGGYQWNQWNPTVAPYFDADSPYWSSQNPWTNSQSFQQLAGLAATLHAEGKKYFAPLSPGFDRQLDGSGGCVPRDNGATLQALYTGNAAGDPQGWLLISWNEITEGTYVTPELQRYGSAYGGPNGFVHALTTGNAAASGCSTHADQPGPGTFLAVAATTGTGGCPGYWLADAAGQVRSFGGAADLGSLSAAPNAPVVGITATPDRGGYWLLGADGGVFSFGDAQFYGSTGALRLNAPVIAMTATADGRGYWLVAQDGGVFSFGDAVFRGSTGGLRLNAPVVGMAATSAGGYWLVGADGGAFSFSAPFLGSMGGSHLNQPVVGITADPAGRGYRMVAADGGIFSFGAPFYGSLGGLSLSAPIRSMAPSLDGNGYYLVGTDGALYAFGDAPYLGRVLS